MKHIVGTVAGFFWICAKGGIKRCVVGADCRSERCVVGAVILTHRLDAHRGIWKVVKSLRKARRSSSRR